MRQSAASALGQLGEHAAPAVPQLTKCLEDREWKVRFWAAEALGELGERLASVIHCAGAVHVVERRRGRRCFPSFARSARPRPPRLGVRRVRVVAREASSAMSTKPSSTSPCVSPCVRKAWRSAPLASHSRKSALASRSVTVHRAACRASSTGAAACHGTKVTSLTGSRHAVARLSSCAGESAERALAAEQAEREGAAGGDPAAGDGPTDAQILDAVDAGALDNVPDPTESIEVGGMLG